MVSGDGSNVGTIEIHELNSHKYQMLGMDIHLRIIFAFAGYQSLDLWPSDFFAQRKDGRSKCGPVAGEQHEWHDPTRTRVSWSQGESAWGEHGTVAAFGSQIGPSWAVRSLPRITGMSAPVMVMFSKSQPVWHPSLRSETS